MKRVKQVWYYLNLTKWLIYEIDLNLNYDKYRQNCKESNFYTLKNYFKNNDRKVNDWNMWVYA